MGDLIKFPRDRRHRQDVEKRKAKLRQSMTRAFSSSLLLLIGLVLLFTAFMVFVDLSR